MSRRSISSVASFRDPVSDAREVVADRLISDRLERRKNKRSSALLGEDEHWSREALTGERDVLDLVG